MGFVQHNGTSTASGTSLSTPFLGNVTAGNMIVVVAGSYDATFAGSDYATPTDTQGNTYTQVFDILTGGFYERQAMWYAQHVVGGPCTVTCTLSPNASFFNFAVLEYSGAGNLAPFDVAASNGNHNSANADTGTTATTSQPSEIVIGSIVDSSGSAFTWPGAFTVRDSGGVALLMEVADKTVAAVGTQNALITIAASSSYAAGIATFTISGQTSQPTSDVSVGGWTTDQGLTTNEYARVNESTVDDTTYVQSSLGPTADPITFNLGALLDPYPGAKTLGYRYSKVTAGMQVNLTVEVLQNSTVVQTWTHTDISATVTEAHQAITGVTDWRAPLSVRFTPTQP